MFKQFL